MSSTDTIRQLKLDIYQKIQFSPKDQLLLHPINRMNVFFIIFFNFKLLNFKFG
jgi:hypothetical protein